MIKVECDKCGKEINEMSALAFSPPKTINKKKNQTTKYHICKSCWKKFKKWLS